MKKLLIVILAALSTIGLVARADAATTINFDEVWNTTGTVVNNQYAGYGITFKTDARDILVNVIVGGNIFPGCSAPNVLAAAGANTDGYISFAFSPPAVDVSFDAFSVEDATTIEYFNAGGVLLETQTGSTATESFSYVAPMGESIGEVVIHASEGAFADPFAIDNVEFTLTPEPTTLSLLALVGLALVRRRR